MATHGCPLLIQENKNRIMKRSILSIERKQAMLHNKSIANTIIENYKEVGVANVSVSQRRAMHTSNHIV